MKKILPVLAILNLFQYFSFAQNTRVDSLLSLIKKAKEDTNKVKHLNSLIAEYRIHSNYILAFEYSNTVLELSKKLNFLNGIATCYNNTAMIYRDKGDYNKALENNFASLKINEEIGDKRGIASSYNNIGIIHWHTKNYDKALDYFLLALKLRKETGDKKAIAASYNNIGSMYHLKDDNNKALQFLYKALKIREEIGDKTEIANSYSNIGEIHLKMENYDKAQEFFMKSLNTRKEMGAKNGAGLDHFNIGTVYLKQNKIFEAKKHLEYSLKDALKAGGKLGIMDSYLLLSRCDSAAVFLNKKSFERTSGFWEGAYKNHYLYSIYKDSLFNDESSKQIHEMSTKYETEKKESQIKLQQTELDKKQEEIKRQNIQRNAFIIGFGLMIALAGVSYRSYRNKRKAHDIITNQKKLVEEKQKEILDSINYAQRIQSAILAKEDDIIKAFPQSFLLYKPKDIVAGDFYFFETTSTHVFYAAADSTGHGVPGALVSVICSNALTRCVKEFGLTEPGKILDKSRELVVETFRKSGQEVKDGMDISFCAFLIKPESNDQVTFQWSGANNPVWFVNSTNEINEIKGDKQPIGFHHEPKPFTTHTVQLQKSDKVYIFTDGYADQFGGEKGKKFKYSKLKELLLAVSDKPMSEQKILLNEKFEDWKGNLEQVDDMCVIGIKV